MTIRVFLIDDHALVRTGMKMILSKEVDVCVVGEAESGEAALPQIRQLKPDIVLCDLHLPGVSGLEITERIVKGDYGTRVIIVSVLEDGPLPKRLLEAGASGYVGKGGDAHELLRAVREVALGRRYLGNTIAQNLALSNLEGGLTVRCIVPTRAGSGLAVDSGSAPGRHRQAPEPQRQDHQYAQSALVRKGRHPGQHRAGTVGQPVWPDRSLQGAVSCCLEHGEAPASQKARSG